MASLPLLVDMNVPPSIARRLTDAGFRAEHAAARGLSRSDDATILAEARARGETIVTFDLDFGALLAAGGERAPSVVVLRLRDTHPDAIANVLLTRLALLSDDLGQGAIVVVADTTMRIRKLPIGGR